MFKKKTLILFFLFFFPIVLTTSISYEKDVNLIDKSPNTFVIDDFEEDNAWIVKYSQFRQRNWNKEITKKNFYEDSQNWLKWINKDDHPELDILQYELVNNSKISQTQKKILALRAKWEPKKQFEWIALEPANIRRSKEYNEKKLFVIADSKTLKPKYKEWDQNKPNFIWLPANTKSLYIYVWSGNYNYVLQAEFQDTKGKNYILPVGKLNHDGWKNLEIVLPENLYKSQTNTSYPKNLNIKFMRFIIKNENQNNLNHHYSNNILYLYFDYFYANVDEIIISSSYSPLQFWDNENNKTSTSTSVTSNSNEVQ